MNLILKPLVADFIKNYPEFKQFVNTLDNLNVLENIINRIKCLFTEYQCINIDGENNCKVTLPFFMLVAHYLVSGGHTKEFGIEVNQGIIASSSIDSVSVSFQGTPYSNSDFKYQLSLTPYGREYLFYLSTHRGVLYIN